MRKKKTTEKVNAGPDGPPLGRAT